MDKELRQRLEEMQSELDQLQVFQRSFLSAAELDPRIARTLKEIVGALKLSDLVDVEDTDSASTGQVLKKTSTTWKPGNDETAP